MFRKNPSKNIPEATLSDLPMPDWVHGFCYWAPQRKMRFGHDRRQPTAWRPAVSLGRYGLWMALLPATSKHNPEFFRIKSEVIFRNHFPTQPAPDSYLSYDKEFVPHHELREIGTLPHPLRIDIANWLKLPH